MGLSKLPRVIEALCRRLQIQERLTVEIASTISDGLQADGVAVLVEAKHHGIMAPGLKKAGSAGATEPIRRKGSCLCASSA